MPAQGHARELAPDTLPARTADTVSCPASWRRTPTLGQGLPDGLLQRRARALPVACMRPVEQALPASICAGGRPRPGTMLHSTHSHAPRTRYARIAAAPGGRRRTSSAPVGPRRMRLSSSSRILSARRSACTSDALTTSACGSACAMSGLNVFASINIHCEHAVENSARQRRVVAGPKPRQQERKPGWQEACRC